SENGAVRLSSDGSHHDTGLGNARLVVDPENNLIELNGEGLRCRRGGAANGNEQNFGVGNPGTGDTPHSDDVLIASDCHVRNTVF
ncbi:MAG: hypothetical protein O6831_03825, partial [Alphaproteobacteria bacterium]|nr:hypothetical protein [Alphaproteobacteria bacterium]